ncbi:MAG: DNA ligase (NAD(+)) LigA, partial [Bacteroidota bacterium]
MYSAAKQKELVSKSKAYLNGELTDLRKSQKTDELIELLQYHEWRYYVLNEPVIGDTEYDLLFKQLEKLEAENQVLMRQLQP